MYPPKQNSPLQEHKMAFPAMIITVIIQMKAINLFIELSHCYNYTLGDESNYYTKIQNNLANVLKHIIQWQN